MALDREVIAEIARLKAEGLRQFQIAAQLGIKARTVRHYFDGAAAEPSWWTPERDAEATRLFLAGATHRQVFQQIGAVSRNAVVGRLTRLGITRPAEVNAANKVAGGRSRFVGQPTTRPVKAAKARPEPKRQQAAPTPALMLVSDSGSVAATITEPFEPTAPKPFEDRRRTECAWPIDMPDGSMLACCEPMTGQRWCRHHTEIGARKTPPHRRREIRRPTGFGFRRTA